MSRTFFYPAAMLAALFSAAALAQGGTAPAPAKGDAEARPAEGPVAPDSPRASLQAYLELARAGRYQEAARYLELTPELAPRGSELVKRLTTVLDRHLWLDPEAASAESPGNLRDGLPPAIEQLGAIPTDHGVREPVRLTRLSGRDGTFWAFSRGTVARIDAWYQALPDRWLRERLPAPLMRSGPRELLYWQWLAMPVLVLLAWGMGRLLGGLTRHVLGRAFAKTQTSWDDQLLKRIGPPLTLAWGLIAFAFAVNALGLAVPARKLMASVLGAGGAVTVFWALWRSADVGAAFLLARPWAAQSASSRNLLAIGVKLFKALVGVGGTVTALAALGYPVATLVAGLGIGGIAIAFGAQKTVENLFGSMAIAVDQPFRVGDLVKVDDFTAEVESVGLRSTRFRTPDRSLISIPNGKVADMKIESLAARDRLRLAFVLGLEYGTTHEQMQAVLAGLDGVLREHPKTWKDGIAVSFRAIGASALEVEVATWFATRDLAEFAACRQEVLLSVLRVVEAAGTRLAYPTRTVHVVEERPAAPSTS